MKRLCASRYVAWMTVFGLCRAGYPLAVDSFALIDASVNASITAFDPLENGARLNLAALPGRSLNIRANTSPVAVGSVRFALDDNPDFRTENVAPYALAGDRDGDYYPWTPAVGRHVVTATPFGEAGAAGTAGAALTVSFVVVDEPLPPTGNVLLLRGAARADHNGPWGLSGLAGIARESGLAPQTMTDADVTLTEAFLKPYAIVVVGPGVRRFVAEEAEEVADFVKRGGGVLVLEEATSGRHEGETGGDRLLRRFRPRTRRGEDGAPRGGAEGFATARYGLGRVAATPGSDARADAGDDKPRDKDAGGREAKKLVAWLAQHASAPVSPRLSIDPRVWRAVTLTFDGPPRSEDGGLNPFLDYRMEVAFSHNGREFRVPGFFAADGDGAETSAAFGRSWRVHFVPDEPGTWIYRVSFRFGADAAVDDDPEAGRPVAFDGGAGSFVVAAPDAATGDPRDKGMLRYAGDHHLRYAATGERFLKAGADSPENFLGYFEFDGTLDTGGLIPDFLHRYEPHAGDWRPGDPSWQGGKGKNIIGALNYLAEAGGNSVYFITYNIDGGDGADTWPWSTPSVRDRFDCSKLDQWEIVFSHMDRLGIQLHLLTQETENNNALDGGELGAIRKLYYRELIARFAHHLALIWNLGEENTNTDAQRKAFAAYIRGVDPYNHPITVHTFYDAASTYYDGLLGDPHFEATSIQGDGARYNAWAADLRRRSAAAGRPWAIYGDEQAPAVDAGMGNLDTLRKTALWGNLMGGGAGIEWYFGYQGDFGDLQSEDWRRAAPLWEMTRHALAFFREELPFWEMEPANELASADGALVLAKPGKVYAVYLPQGGTTELDAAAGAYEVAWYDPRRGGELLRGSTTRITGPGRKTLGRPPGDPTQDWVALVRAAPEETRLPRWESRSIPGTT